MKRDVDLSRAVLRFVEEHAPPQGGVQTPLEIEGYDHPTVLAHAELLIEDGLIDGRVVKALGGPVNRSRSTGRLVPTTALADFAARADTGAW
jgi:hypothetical protein